MDLSGGDIWGGKRKKKFFCEKSGAGRGRGSGE